MFWENFVSLCAKNGTSPNAVAAQLSLSSGSVTAWKGGSVPRETTLKKIADYFDVSVDFLIGRDKKENPTPGGVELTEAQKRAMELIRKMDDDTLERFVAAAKAMLGES